MGWSRALACAVIYLFSVPSALADSFDQKVEALVRPLANGLSSVVFFKIELFGEAFPLIVLWLALAAVFFTLYLGFINIRGFGLAVRHVRGHYHNPEANGEISHFQAVATAISGTVGIGNIGGVAVAIVIYNADGSVSGGPMYYLEHFLSQRGAPGWGRLLGGFYALSLVIGCLGIGNMFQSNQAYVQFVVITGGEQSFFAERGWLFGLLIAAAVGVVIIGGIRSIARVAAHIVPFMGILYAICAVIIIAMSAEHIPGALALIWNSAFSAESVTGGMVGAIIVGFQRALFSNEAGIGSASIAHSAVQTNEPASEGLVSLLEPFIDTVVICSLSSLVIVTTAYPNGLMEGGLEGIALTSAAFEHHFSWAPYPLAVAALLFAFSTSISWSYYGLKGWTYLFGEGRVTQMIFKAIFCSFIALGCMIQLTAVLDFSDAMVFLIAIPNILGLYLFAPEVKREVQDYMRRVRAGEVHINES
jgi:AGCS family alanine or glycine:cation symporter